MIHAFADASVLYSGIASSSGASREVLRRHRLNEIELVVSDYVVLETSRNLAEDDPALARGLDLLIDVLLLRFVETTQEAVNAANVYTELKDAPVIAAAIAGGCGYLLTFDRKHLINPVEVAEKSGLNILTPGDLLQILRSDE